MGDEFEEIDSNDLGDGRSLHQYRTEFPDLPGKWYLSYYYYTGVDGIEDGMLTGMSWTALEETTDLEESKQAIEEIYGACDEFYSNPISNSIIPYSCYQWNEVKDDETEYSVELIDLEEDYYILFSLPCHSINEKELKNAVSEAVKTELQDEFGDNPQIEIQQYERISPLYASVICTDDLGMRVINLSTEEASSDYVWVDVKVESGSQVYQEKEEYNVILYYADGDWKIFGEFKAME